MRGSRAEPIVGRGGGGRLGKPGASVSAGALARTWLQAALGLGFVCPDSGEKLAAAGGGRSDTNDKPKWVSVLAAVEPAGAVLQVKSLWIGRVLVSESEKLGPGSRVEPLQTGLGWGKGRRGGPWQGDAVSLGDKDPGMQWVRPGSLL